MESPLPEGLVEEFDRYLKDDYLRPRGADIYPGVFESPILFPLQRPAEMAEMIRVARTVNPKVVVEIGADKGGGFYHWVKCLHSVTRAIACEVRGTPYGQLLSAAFPEVDFLWLPHSSYDPRTVYLVDQWLRTDRIDCLFIDGDKGRFLLDFESYKPLMNPNGVVFFHDIQDSPVPKSAWEEVNRRGYRTQEIRDISDSLAAMERQKQGLSSSCPHENWLRHWRGKSCGVGVIYLGKCT